jgi:hypothetical protein
LYVFDSNVSCIETGTQNWNAYPMKVPKNPSGATPMIVCSTPFIFCVFPRIAGSPLKRRFQS